MTLGFLPGVDMSLLKVHRFPSRKSHFPSQLSCSVGEIKVLWLELLHSSPPTAGKPGRVAGMVPVPEGAVDCRVYLLLEAAVRRAEGRFRKFPE